MDWRGFEACRVKGLFAVILSSWQSAVQAGTSCRPGLLVSQAQCGLSGWEMRDVIFPRSAGLCSFCPLSAFPASPPPRWASLQRGEGGGGGGGGGGCGGRFHVGFIVMEEEADLRSDDSVFRVPGQDCGSVQEEETGNLSKT